MFHKFLWPIMLPDEIEIVEAFYCCLILNKIAILEVVTIYQSYEFYKVVDTNDTNGSLPSRLTVQALCFLQLKKEDMECQCDAQFLEVLGINVHGSTLEMHAEGV
jgi:hypothetical protein